jgi:hypothetical protein
MKTIYSKLAITPEQYESMIFNLYSNWCISVTTTEREFQQVLANSSVNAWFRIELTKCEAEFINLTKLYTNPNVTASDYNKCYSDCTLNLFNIRPMPLLAPIVKRKVKGTRVLNILSQN